MLSTLFRPFRVPQQKSWRKRTGNKKFQLVWDESWMTKYTNTNTQIHKYTNTVWVKLGDRPIMCYIFEKDIVWGPQKQCSQVSDIKIYKYKYTNTQIHKYSLGQNHQQQHHHHHPTTKANSRTLVKTTYVFFDLIFTKICSQVSYIHKYKCTNTQIQFGSNLEIDL